MSGVRRSLARSRGSASLTVLDAFRWRAPVVTDPIRACELLVGLPDVAILGVADGIPLRVFVELRVEPPDCGGCGTVARVKERPEVELVDLPVFGRQARLVCGESTAGSARSEPAQWRRGRARIQGSPHHAWASRIEPVAG